MKTTKIQEITKTTIINTTPIFISTTSVTTTNPIKTDLDNMIPLIVNPDLKPQVQSVISFEHDLYKDILDNKQKNENRLDFNKNVLILISVFGVLSSLILGMILGFFFKKFFKKQFVKRFTKKTKSNSEIEKKNENNLNCLSTNNESLKIRLARTSLNEDKTSVSVATDEDSFGSSQKSNAAFIYSNRNQLQNNNNNNNNKTKNYFTVQNDYGIFPKTILNQSDYFKLAASNTTTDVTNITNETRLSSDSSSSSSSSSYALINQLNQTSCFLNSSNNTTNNQLKLLNENIDSASRYYNKTMSKSNNNESIDYSGQIFRNKIDKNYSFSSSSTPSSYSPSVTAAAVIESTYSSMNSHNNQNSNDIYYKNHHLKKKSLNVYQTRSPSVSNQEVLSIASMPMNRSDDDNIYSKIPIDDLFLNNSYV